MLPKDHPIVKRLPLQENGKGPISSHRLHAIVLKVGCSYRQQIRGVDRTDGCRALHHGPEGIAIFLVATVPTIQEFRLLCVLGAVAKEIRSEDWILMRILGRLLAAMLLLQPPDRLASSQPAEDEVGHHNYHKRSTELERDSHRESRREDQRSRFFSATRGGRNATMAAAIDYWIPLM